MISMIPATSTLNGIRRDQELVSDISTTSPKRRRGPRRPRRRSIYRSTAHAKGGTIIPPWGGSLHRQVLPRPKLPQRPLEARDVTLELDVAVGVDHAVEVEHPPRHLCEL